MTTQNNTANNGANSTEETGKNKPTHVAKVRHGEGDNATYEQIGVAWQTDTGSLYIKLSGTQIVSNFALYPINTKAEA